MITVRISDSFFVIDAVSVAPAPEVRTRAKVATLWSTLLLPPHVHAPHDHAFHMNHWEHPHGHILTRIDELPSKFYLSPMCIGTFAPGPLLRPRARCMIYIPRECSLLWLRSFLVRLTYSNLLPACKGTPPLLALNLSLTVLTVYRVRPCAG
jgi:hypothetical protein